MGENPLQRPHWPKYVSSCWIALVLVAGGGSVARAADPEPPRLHLGGFFDVDLTHSFTHQTTRMEAGELDLFASARINGNWSFLTEGVVQHINRKIDFDDPTADRKTEADLERFYLAYTRSDAFRLELGEIHTGIVQWNEREHRSRFLQTPIDVPGMSRREEQKGAWPLHFVGIWASGRAGGPLGITYGGGVGNGRSSKRDEIQILTDDNSSHAYLLTAGIAPQAVEGLEVTATGYLDTIPAPEGALRERDATLSLSYELGGFELRSEYGQMRHDPVYTAGIFRTTGWYLLISKRLLGRLEKFRPYVLMDSVKVPRGEAYLADVPSDRGWSAGARWDAKPYLAIKTDYHSVTISENHDHSVRAEIALSF